jgi:hypothetical protein
MYQLTSSDSIIRLSDNAFIPQAPGNRDYREYLDWLDAGNTPEPAPPPPCTRPGLPSLLGCADGFHRLRRHPRAVIHQPAHEHARH